MNKSDTTKYLSPGISLFLEIKFKNEIKLITPEKCPVQRARLKSLTGCVWTSDRSLPTPGLDNKTQKWKREHEFDAPGSDALCTSTDFMTLEIIDRLNRRAPSERHQPECVTFAKVWDHRVSEDAQSGSYT